MDLILDGIRGLKMGNILISIPSEWVIFNKDLSITLREKYTIPIELHFGSSNNYDLNKWLKKNVEMMMYDGCSIITKVDAKVKKLK